MITIKEIPLKDTVQRFFDKAEENCLERRDGQREMTQEVTDAILGRYPLAVEAGVGIGKSFAYLVPAVLNFFRERRQVIIATSTIALQEQLESDLHTVLKMLGVKAEVIVATGMKNYICRRKLMKKLLRHGCYDEMLISIKEKVDDGKSCRKDMQLDIPDDTWDKICINNYGEYCADCYRKCECAYHQMRQRLRDESCFVICNQNMLIAHLINEDKGSAPIFNDNVRTFIIDEAHNLEPKFRDAFTKSLTKPQIVGEIKAAARKINDPKLGKDLIDKIKLLFRFLKADIHRQQSEADGDMQTFYYNKATEIRHLLNDITADMAKLEKQAKYRLYCSDFLLEMCEPDGEKLIWLDNSDELKICVCKKDIKADISKLLFRKGMSTVMTSATISTGGMEGYRYYLDSIGYPRNTDVSEPKLSPFDYDSKTMLYTSAALPYPSVDAKDDYRRRSIAEIVKLLNITHGKTLILFTAKEDMEYVYKRLSYMKLPYKILMQGKGSSQEYLLGKFREDTDSVLLGTGTFWEGINVEGEALSQVIIFKLPFPVPDPIVDYKMSLVEDRVREVAVPEMIIKLKQGAGRLIRSSSDKGIVSILDPRASSRENKQYRPRILDALCEKNCTEDIIDLAEFWDRLITKEAVV